MASRIEGDGGFQGLFDNLFQNLGQRTAQIGDLIQVRKGQSLLAPPQGSLWHSPAWARGLFELHDLIQRPVFEVGDVFGIHPRDPIPLPPRGTQLKRLDNPKPADGLTGASVYQVVLPPEMAAVLALPKPRPPTLKAYAVGEQPTPRPGERWQVAYVDGRNLRNVVGAMVAV